MTLSPPPSPASPQVPGTSVLWTAVAGGGSGNYQYQFWLNDGTSWSIAKPYGATNDNTWTWDTTGLATGTYSVQVWARSAGSTAVRSVHAGDDLRPGAAISPATGVTLSPPPSPASPQAPGASVLWTAVASGGSGNYQYEFWLHNGTSLVPREARTARRTTTAGPGTPPGWPPGRTRCRCGCVSAGSTALYEAFTPWRPTSSNDAGSGRKHRQGEGDEELRG